ncbi:MAG: hypothetical protein ACI9ES_001531 [Oceanospirillaceae bacterium]|jgi:hypothetical protein
MSSDIEAKGNCLCGAVKIHAQSMNTKVGACHCNTCRKWNGGPLLAVDCKSAVSFEGKENITVFDSSQWAERAFCSKCGTHLFYRLKEQNQYIVPAGILEAESKLHFDHQIFIDQQPQYYSFANETKNMTGEEVFAQYAGEK